MAIMAMLRVEIDMAIAVVNTVYTLNIDAWEQDSFLSFTFFRCFRWLFWVSHSDKQGWNIMFLLECITMQLPKLQRLAIEWDIDRFVVALGRWFILFSWNGSLFGHLVCSKFAMPVKAYHNLKPKLRFRSPHKTLRFLQCFLGGSTNKTKADFWNSTDWSCCYWAWTYNRQGFGASDPCLRGRNRHKWTSTVL